MSIPRLPLWLAVTCSLGLAACGGGGSSPSNPGPVSTGPSVAALVFPPAPSLTDGTTLRVKGTADDPDGVASVTVNGVAATTSDAFAHWEALVPLVVGPNDLVVDVEDATTDVTPDAADPLAATRVPYLPTWPVALGRDAATGRYLALDRDARGLFQVDLATGDGGLVSGQGLGAGPAWSRPVDLAVDPAGGLAYVLDQGTVTVVAVDLATGDRTVVSGGGMGAGPAFSQPAALALDAAGGRLFVGNGGTDDVAQVTIATGDRVVVSSGAVGNGPLAQDPRRMVYVPADDALLVADGTSGAPALLRIDVPSGDRTLVSDLKDALQGPLVSGPTAMLYDAAGPTLYLVNQYSLDLLSVDLATGQRVKVSGSGVGAGTNLRYVMGLALDPLSGDLVALDWDVGGLVLVDPATGDRTVAYQVSRGTGVVLGRTYGIAASADDSTLYAADFFEALVTVDPATGDRTPLAGNGPAVSSAISLALDAVGGRLFTRVSWGGQPAVMAQDLATGDRVLVSGAGVGAGPAFTSGSEMAFDAPADRLLMVQSTSHTLLGIDRTTGDRVEVSGPSVGLGPALASPYGVTMGPAAGQALVYDLGLAEILLVDLATGDRTLVSGGAMGAGPSMPVTSTARLVLDAPGGRALLLGGEVLVAVDLLTGDRTVVSGPGVGLGPVLSSVASGLAVNAAGDLAWVADNGSNTILAIDLATGDRVVIAR